MGFDSGHVIGILFGDDGVVAADILEVKEPAGVGIERFLATGIEAGEAPMAWLLVEPLDHGRAVGEEVGTGVGIEAVADEGEVDEEEGEGEAGFALPEDEADGEDNEANVKALPEEVTVEGFDMGEGVAGLGEAEEDVIELWFEGGVEEAGGEEGEEAEETEAGEADREALGPRAVLLA